MKKRLIISVIVILTMLFAFQIYQKTASSKKTGRRGRRQMPLAVETQPVQIDTIRRIGEFSGTLDPSSKILIAPKIAGRVEKILVNIGDGVEGDQLLAVLDDEEFRQQVIQADAEFNVAKANLMERRNALENARREYDRTQVLREKKIVSESQLDTVQSNFKAQEAKLAVAIAQVAQKESALKAVNIRLGYTRIRLPKSEFSGKRFVGERFVDEGALLSTNQPIVSILDIEKLIAVIHVIERDYAKIKNGLSARITTDAFKEREFTGKVLRIAPLIKETSRQARVEIEILNEDLMLKPGMFVRVAIEFEMHERAVLIPQLSLVRRDGVEGIFMADRSENKATFVPVTLGLVNETMAEVITPLNLTGNVITLGHHLLKDGMPIILPGDGPPENKNQKKKSRKKKKTEGGNQP